LATAIAFVYFWNINDKDGAILAIVFGTFFSIISFYLIYWANKTITEAEKKGYIRKK